MLSYRKLAMRVLGRPLHTGGGIDSPRPASQRAAALVLTAAMLTTLAAPAFAKTWCIEDGNITVKAGDTGNDVTQKGETTYGDTDTVITNNNRDTASSHTVTIDAGNDKVEVTLKDVNINVGSDSGSALTSNGDVTLTLKGDNSLTGGNGGSGISSNGSLTITGGENDSLTAKGGSGRSGIFSSGGVTISGGTVNATGGSSGSDSGDGIHSGSLTMKGGTVNAKGGSGADGGSGIRTFSSGSLTISGGTVTATGGNNTGSDGSGGSGIYSVSGSVTISGGTVNATGGNGGSARGSHGGNGISGKGRLTVSGGTVNANGGNGSKSESSDRSNGGRGIDSGSLTVSGGTVTANGGDGCSGSYSDGGIGISSSSGGVTISGGTVTATGGKSGSGSYRGGYGIISNDIDLSGSLELTAKAGSPNGKALSQNGIELDPNTFKEKLDPGANIITKDADGKVINQVSSPRPVEPEGPVIPEESSSSSDSGSSTPSADGGSATPSAPASPLPGLTVTDKDGQRISYTSTQSGNTLTVCVGRFTASFRISLAALRQLRAEGIETIAFQTILCSTTLSVDELLAMGGEDTEVVLTHHIRSSTLTVNGKAV